MNNYFPHDSNSRNSDKLLPVRMKYGAEGYGIYFMILERLRDEKNYMSVKDYNVLAFDLRVDAGKVKSIVEDFGLFAFTDDGECFYSEGFNKRMEIKDEKSKKRSEAGKKGAEKRWQKNSNANGKAKATPPDSNGKETKGKETKVNKTKEMLAARDEIQRLYQEKIRPMDSPQNIDRVQSFLEDGISLEVIICAIHVSNRDGGKSASYVVRKLNDWKKRGVKTVDDAKKADEAWKAEFSNKSNGKKLENTGSSEYDNLGW